MKAPSEKHLETWIVDNVSHFGSVWEDAASSGAVPEMAVWLNESDVISPFFEQIITRQIHLPHGIPDLIATSKEQMTVVELKKGPITIETVGQCLRYMYDLREILWYAVFDHQNGVGIDHYSHTWTLEQTEFPHDEIAGMVVGSIVSDSWLPLVCAACGIQVVTYDYDGTSYWFHRQFITDQLEVGTAHQDYLTGTLGIALKEILRAREGLKT